MTDDILLLSLLKAALVGQTAVGGNVFSPRNWPTDPSEMPIILLGTPAEEKQGMGRSGGPQFTVLGTFPLIARVTAKAEAGDAAAGAVETAILTLKRQIEVAVINDYELRRVIQTHAFVRSSSKVDNRGEVVIGELNMEFGLEYYQGPEDFHPVDGDAIEEFAIYADLINVFSPTGTFTGSEAEAFPDSIEPAPRTSGPDGRPEGLVEITLPQP